MQVSYVTAGLQLVISLVALAMMQAINWFPQVQKSKVVDTQEVKASWHDWQDALGDPDT
jgi:hypothetical protein